METMREGAVVRIDRAALRRAPIARTAPPDRIGVAAVWFTGVYLILKMLYIFNEGNAQPADIMMAALAFFITSPSAVMKFLREELVLTALVFWVLVVNGVWFMLTARIGFMTAASYYLFNLVIVMAVFSTRLRAPALFDRVIPKAALVSIALEFFVVATGIGVRVESGHRIYGTFQNPNQLAYWGVAVLSTLLVLRRNRIVLWDLPFIAMVLYIELASISRAGIISTLALAVIWMFFALRTPLKRLIGMLLGIMVFALISIAPVVTSYLSNASAIETSEERFSQKSDQSQYEVRNYSRIVNFYQYTVFGAGESYFSRFVGPGELAIEIHSSFGTMLFSYGIVGLLLFVGVIVNLMRRLPIGIGIYILPSLFYGLTHQGLRFSFFWVLVALMIALIRELAVDKTAEKVARPSRTFAPRGEDYLRALASPARGAKG